MYDSIFITSEREERVSIQTRASGIFKSTYFVNILDKCSEEKHRKGSCHFRTISQMPKNLKVGNECVTSWSESKKPDDSH